MTYHDNLSKWVIGQVVTQSTNGIESVRTDYNANALPHRIYSFGKLQQTLTYHPDGTLATVSDGRDSDAFDTTIHLFDWKRGIPQQIQHPATTDHPVVYEKAGVNDRGEIEWVTDENGYKTCYTYDAMGRLASTTYPSESQAGTCDTITWNPNTRDFAKVPPRYGLPEHWRLLSTTGNGWQIVRYDALWRPVIEEAFDAPIAAATRSFVVKRYDTAGRLAFQSYPVRTLSDFNDPTLKGIRTEYDALDRVTAVRQDSEHGVLSTTTEYLPGLKTRVTSPKHQNTGIYTETTYQAWDQPTTEFPVSIAQPEGVFTDIGRDTFGKPLTLTRRNADNSEWKRHYFIYDTHQRLCKRTDVETGTNAFGYDDAGNLTWSAAGQSWSPTGACLDAASPAVVARKVARNYDARNRLKTLRFPDTRGDQDWSYTADGLPSSITTVNVPGAVHPINQYSYNRRRLLTTEAQHLPAWYTYSLGYSYDGNGYLKQINYPSTDYVDYAPNALGQATQAVGSSRTYASGVTYHPNGSMAGFTYGNGMAYSMTQNARQLPEIVQSSGGALHYDYRYDTNGNIGTIYDNVRGLWGHRYMSYDGLDRLTHLGAPTLAALGDSHHMHFSYDALDNIKTVTMPAFGGGMVRDHRYCYNANNRLEFVRTGATTCDNGAAATYFAYDVQGNVQQKNGQAFDFDYGNRLREVIDVERYRYDAHGRRILAMNFASGTVFSQYGQTGQLLYQKNTRTGQAKQIDHVYLAGSLIAQREQPIGGATVTVKYQHTDALGSPVVVTDQNRNILERVDYGPYGQPLNAVANTGQDRPGYAGHVRDAATGLNYMQQRYYDPESGRFLSIDPVAANSSTGANFNRYWYANNNPYRFTDPDGRCPTVSQYNHDYVCSDRSDIKAGMAQRAGTESTGEHKALTRGQAFANNFHNNIHKSPLGPGGKNAMRFIYNDVIDGVVGNLIDGNFAPAAQNLAIGMIVKKLGPLSDRAEDLIGEARKLYPGKAGKIEQHHEIPKYLGGPANGRTVPLDAAYHQQITNEFRRLHPYGSAQPDAQQLNELMQRVYEKYPLP